jgi:hypothetical protein
LTTTESVFSGGVGDDGDDGDDGPLLLEPHCGDT